MHTRKRFIARNEGFLCMSCGSEVGPAEGTFRNHCPYCLVSRHVDGDVPGDRAMLEECGGLMPAARVEMKDGGFRILHRCEKCGHERANRVAPDDDLRVILGD